MSPEQARGEAYRVDGRSDIFSLGIVMYELLTGRRPFRGDSRELLDQIQTVNVRPLRQIDDRIPRELERICLKALSKRPADRYATAGDMADELRDFLSLAQQRTAPEWTQPARGAQERSISPDRTPVPAPEKSDAPSASAVNPPLAGAFRIAPYTSASPSRMRNCCGTWRRSSRARGHHVFVDRHMAIGVEWAKELEEQLRASQAVVLLLSAQGVRSEMLAWEVQIAHDEAQKTRRQAALVAGADQLRGSAARRAGGSARSAAVLPLAWAGGQSATGRRIVERTAKSAAAQEGPAAQRRRPTRLQILRGATDGPGIPVGPGPAGQRDPAPRGSPDGQDLVAGPRPAPDASRWHPGRHDGFPEAQRGRPGIHRSLLSHAGHLAGRRAGPEHNARFRLEPAPGPQRELRALHPPRGPGKERRAPGLGHGRGRSPFPLYLRQRGVRAVPLLAQRPHLAAPFAVVPADPGHRLRHGSPPLHHRPEPVAVQRRHPRGAGGFHDRAGGGAQSLLRLAPPDG